MEGGRWKGKGGGGRKKESDGTRSNFGLGVNNNKIL